MSYITSDIKTGSIEQLRNLTPLELKQYDLFYCIEDGKEGNFKVDLTDTTSVDNLGTILVTTSGTRLKRVITNNEVFPEWFGAVGDGVADDYFALQGAIFAAQDKKLKLSARIYKTTFPLFINSNTVIEGAGIKSIVKFIDPNFTKGRGGFVLGSTREANKALAIQVFPSGSTYGKTVNSTTYTNPAIGQYLENNNSLTECENSHIRNLSIIAEFTSPTAWGGYGINFVNAKNCTCNDIYGTGWTQLIGMGSDVAPETPSNYNCHAYDLVVNSPDLVHTYYSIGFISNSTKCSIRNAKQINPCTAGSPDGSGVATNYTENCVIENITKFGANSKLRGCIC